jgi:succinate dehydrogenase hydrophobic anchor subunit
VKLAKFGWFMQVLSGVLLVFLLGLHWVAQHYIAVGGLRTYQDVVSYLRNPLVFLLESMFLILVTLHALLGVRAILVDLGMGKRAGRVVSWGLSILGAAAIWYGLDLLVAITVLR